VKPVNNKIIVRVNMAQKTSMKIGSVEVSMAMNYESNHRVKSPVLAIVVEGNQYLKKDDIIICHHNHFYGNSPYFLQDDLYSIPFNHTIFGVIDDKGDLNPVCGNVFCKRVEIPSEIPLPPDQIKFYNNQGIISNSYMKKYKVGKILFTRPSALYDIVYFWQSEKKIVTKVTESMICGVSV